MLYPVAIEAGDETHSFGVIVPDLNGCFSAGDTFEDAVSSAREAIIFHLEGMIADGMPIPQASTIQTYQDHLDFVGFTWVIVDSTRSPESGLN